MATMKTLNGYGFNATEFNGKTSDSYLQLGDDGTGSTGAAPTINAGTFGGMTVAQFVDMIYPIGSIYMSTSSTSPESLFGGTWESIDGRFLLGAGDSYTVGSTGGQSSVKLVKANIPPLSLYYSGENEPARPCISASALYTGHKQNGYVDAVNTQNTNPTPVSTMPPYLAVYMWKRTA